MNHSSEKIFPIIPLGIIFSKIQQHELLVNGYVYNNDIICYVPGEANQKKSKYKWMEILFPGFGQMIFYFKVTNQQENTL